MNLSIGNIVEDLTRWRDSFLENRMAMGKAKRTIAIYGGVLDELVEFSRPYQDQVSIRDMNQFFVTNFFNEKEITESAKLLKNPTGRHGFSATSKGLYLRIIKMFLLFISENNIESVDLTNLNRKFKITPVEVEKPRIEEKDINRVENYLAKMEKEGRRAVTTYRNALMFNICLETGIRAMELVSLRYSDLVPCEFDDGEGNSQSGYKFLVIGKKKKQRILYILGDKIAEELEFLTKHYQPSDFIAASTRGGTALAPNKIYELFDRIYRGACVNKRGVHILRHTMARRKVAKNVNLVTISEILGHSSIAVTHKFYAKTNEENKMAALMGLNHGTKKPPV